MHTQKKMQDFLFFHPVKKTISLLGNNNFTAARIHIIQFFTRPQHNFHRTHLDFIIIFNLSEEERDRERERKENERVDSLYICHHVCYTPNYTFERTHTLCITMYLQFIFQSVPNQVKMLFKTLNVLEKTQIYHAKIAVAFIFDTGCAYLSYLV